MDPRIVQLSTRDLLLIAATLITAIAGFEAGYLRDLKDKIIGLSLNATTKEMLKQNGWLSMRCKYRTLWLGFTLFSLAAAATILVFFVNSVYLAIISPQDRLWSSFWSLIAFLMFVGWLFLMKTGITFHDFKDPGNLYEKGIIEKSQEVTNMTDIDVGKQLVEIKKLLTKNERRANIQWVYNIGFAGMIGSVALLDRNIGAAIVVFVLGLGMMMLAPYIKR